MDMVVLEDPGGHKYPAGQVPEQDELLVPTATPKVPPGHGVHAIASYSVLYCPGLHRAHDEPLKYDPAWQPLFLYHHPIL